MTHEYATLPHIGIQTLEPYIPGKSIEELTQELGLTDIIKLASNENPRGCSPRVPLALASLSTQQISNYPIPSAHPLPAALCKMLGIEIDCLTLSNGSDALFQLLINCFALHRDVHILTHDYAFQTYGILAKTYGIPLINTPLLNDWNVNVDAMIKACNEKTALIFIANPNNPTGGYLPHNEIKRLLTHIPETTILVLDEAYHEFIEPQDQKHSIDLMHQHPNLVITRTFSKGYGLAGLRLGYGISHPSIRNLIQRIVLPFTVNQAALTAGLAALEDQEFVQQSAELNRLELNRVRQELIHHGFSCLPSKANFITFDCRMNGITLYNALLKKGIIVRPLQAYGLNNYLRVTIGTTEQNTRFLDTLLKIQ